MGNKRKKLSQAEIWDDSALLQSWEDALEEYKAHQSLYHSIHARGERVEDVIRAVEADEEAEHAMNNGTGIQAKQAHPFGAMDEELEDGELEEEIVQRSSIAQSNEEKNTVFGF
ncbi:MAG: hypothetical protein Q9164_000099 [Protoblastenia rupestris]